MIKPLPRPFARVPGTAGAATLASGEVVMILNNAADLTAPGMPAAAVAAGAVDEVAPLERMAARIAATWSPAC